MTFADAIYIDLLKQIMEEGDRMETRNHPTFSHINLPNTTFTEFPLVTLKRTAVKMAIREQEWFLSGEPDCPEELLPWWEKQLNSKKQLLDGYPAQFRASSSVEPEEGESYYFDQLEFVLKELKEHPNSRRILIDLWNPGEMAHITYTNDNPNTPTCCHTIVAQFFVRNGILHMKSYQRSADMLLGVPHNWAQSWAFLTYLAYHTGYEVGSMTWMWGDAQIYQEETHLQAVNEMRLAGEYLSLTEPLKLEYHYFGEVGFDGVPRFLAKDFSIVGEVPTPVVTHKITLL